MRTASRRVRLMALAAILALSACSEPAGTPSAEPAHTQSTAVTPTQAAAVTPGPTEPGATGKGVTIVIIDRGIDWRNPDFLNPDGTTRIRAALDMSAQTNWCASGRPKPVEISRDQINAALRGQGALDFRDAVGHGTATAGLAAGNGRAIASGLYRGIAPEADLVIIKATSEGAPAHDGQPAEAPFNACIADAIDWADARITEIGQPAVVIWNSGTQWGPIDGTSAVSRKIASLFAPNAAGRVWVVGSGDEGGLPNHAGADYSPGAPAKIQFELTGDATYPSAWYTGNAPASVTIELAGGARVGPIKVDASGAAQGITITQYRPGEEFDPWTSTSGDRAVWMNVTGHRGERGTMTFTATGAAGGHVDVYGDVLGPTPLTSAIEFGADRLVPGRLNDLASTPGVIVAGVHVALERFAAMDGSTGDFRSEGPLGGLWIRSSGGPTRDGRQAVDVTAAGQNLPASLAADSYWSTIPSLMPLDGEGRYFRFGGTSASAPLVVGTIALMLEVNPTLTTDQIRQILHETARSDSFTGQTPNPEWGYGKLDIGAAVAAVR